jgi:autotransporter translocation and assembly factor TamB
MRRLRRIAVWVARLALLASAAVVALVVAAVLAARTEPGRAWIRELVLAKARETVPGLDFARIRGNFVDRIAFDDVSVIDRAGRRAIAARRVALTFELWPLLRRTVRVRELRIETPVVMGRPDADGRSNLAQLTRTTGAPERPAAARTAPSRWRLQLERLCVVAGAADLRATDGASTLVSGLTLDAAGSWEAGDAAVDVHRLALHVEQDGRPADVALAGDARFGPAAIAAGLRTLRVNGLLPSDPLEVTGTVAGPPGRLAIDVTADGDRAGRARLHGTIALARGGIDGRTLGAYDLALSSSPIVLSRLAPALPEGRVALTVEAHGNGVPLAPGSQAALTVNVPPGRVAGIAIHGMHLAATSDGDRWRIRRGALRASGATLAFDARGVGARLTGDVEIDVRGPLDGERRRQPEHARLPDVRGRGHLALHVTALVPHELDLTARATARDVAAGAFHLGALSLDARASATRATLRGSLQLAGHDLTFGPAMPRLDALSLEAASEGGVVRLRGSASGPRLRAALALHGPLSPRRARITIDQLSLAVETRAYKQSLALQAPAVLDYQAGDVVALSGADLRGAGYLLTGGVRAGGRYSLVPEARGPMGALALTLRRASLAGLDPVDATVQASVDQRRATATLDAVVGRGRVRASAELPVAVPARGLPRLALRGPVVVRLGARGLALADLPATSARMLRAGITGGRLDVTLAVDGDVTHPTASGALELRALELRGLGAAAWQRRGEIRDLSVSARLDARPGALAASGTAQLRGVRFLRVDARSETDLGALLAGAPLADVPLSVTGDIPRFDLSWLSEIAGGAFSGVGGTLTGHVEASGTLRHPSARADIRVANAAVDQVAFREVLLHGETRDGVNAVDLALSLPQVGGGALYAEAHVQGGGAGSLRAHVGAQDVDVAFLRPFLPSVRELGGILQATIDAKGTRAAPEVHGQVAFRNGRIGVIGQPTFHDVTVAASLDPRRADLGKLSMRSGRGTLTAHGSAEMEGLAPQAVSVEAHADDFLVSVGGMGARIDGDIAAEAALRAALISGKVRVPHAVVQLPGLSAAGGRKLQEVKPRADVRFVDPAARAAAERQAREAQTATRPARRLDFTADADPVYVRSKDFDLEVESRLQIATAASRTGPPVPSISGTVRVRRGTVTLSGQRYDVERGQLAFDGSPEPNPGLDIRLSHRFPDATVIIALGGTAKHPDLQLTSDPPVYEQAQILSLILTGQSGTGPGGAGSPIASGAPGPGGLPFDPASAVASLVLGRLADTLAPELGLDVLRVQNVEMRTAGGAPTGLTDTRVEVGKYVTDRIYISYAHIFGGTETSNANEARIEYRLTNRWLIQTIFGDAGAGSIDALWTYRH